MEEIVPQVKNYAWGITGSNSIVSKVALANGSISSIDSNQHYAELWYGDHPNGPAVIKGNMSQTIDQYLKENREYFCPNVQDTRLPYLLKLLSNEAALSIQCHPDSETAKKLYERDPKTYPSPTHKPEISIALADQVESLCGFRPWTQITTIFRELPAAGELVGGDEFFVKLEKIELNDEKLKALFTAIQRAPQDKVEKTLDSICGIVPTPKNPHALQAYNLCKRLVEQFPKDVGCLAPLYMNFFVTTPGQCIFLRPNVLHAYIQGQIIECMAASDNVIRGGLTPKPRDVELLISTVDYSTSANTLNPWCYPKNVEIQWTGPTKPLAHIYHPPVRDFALVVLVIDAGVSLTYNIPSAVPAILTVLCGCGDLDVSINDKVKKSKRNACQGTSLLLGAKSKLTMTHSEKASARTKRESQFPSVTDVLRGGRMGSFVCLIAMAGKN